MVNVGKPSGGIYVTRPIVVAIVKRLHTTNGSEAGVLDSNELANGLPGSVFYIKNKLLYHLHFTIFFIPQGGCLSF